MKQITPEQLRCLNTLVSKLKITKDKKEALVHAFSNSRSISSKYLYADEAAAMIKHLKELDPDEKLRKKVFAVAYEAGFIYGDSPEDKRMNTAKLNAFLLKCGTAKKELNAMTGAELARVVAQFKQIVKHTNESKASKATKSLLSTLNISVQDTKHQKV